MTADAPVAGSDAGADAAEPFAPTQLSGLVLWLDASENVTTSQSKVSAWGDRSAKNNNAAQAVAQIQPTLVTGAINSRPAIRFAQSALAITDSPTLQWGTDDFGLFVVAAYKNTSNAYGMIVGKQSTTTPFPGPTLWGNFPLPAQDTVVSVQTESSANQYALSTNGKNDAAFRLYVGRRVEGNLELRVNGTVQGTKTTTANNVSATGFPFYIGGAVGSANAIVQPLDGDIAEVVFVRGAITAAELTQLEAYLKAKYAL